MTQLAKWRASWTTRIRHNPKQINHEVFKTSNYNKYFFDYHSEQFNLDIVNFKNNHFKEKTECATRKASELCLKLISNHLPNLLGGSADLTGSNNSNGERDWAVLPTLLRTLIQRRSVVKKQLKVELAIYCRKDSFYFQDVSSENSFSYRHLNKVMNV